MTGLQLKEKIERLKLGLPVIIATGYAEIPAGSDARLRLSKPFTQDQLAVVLHTAMDSVEA